MNRACFCLILSLAATALAQPQKKAPPPVPREDDYHLGPDSVRQPGVPGGNIFQFKFTDSKVFPGTSRTISVYVPAQYKAEKPACVYVALDGLGFLAPVVFDNLIHQKEIPLLIGIGISPGQVDSATPPQSPRFNRSLEFDGLNDSLARLVLDEILPEVEKQKTPDGLPILLSKNPNDRCTAGGSTGGIAAFTLAWERPDAFRRVFSAIGTFVGMRGGDRYPVLVRKTEPKPIRIFLQDGSNDQWMGGPEVGDWWMSNQTLERALTFAGYQVEHKWGTGLHSGRHPAAIFPDAMRYLWKGWPQPVKAGETQNTFLKAILLPDADWRVVPEINQPVESLVCSPAGGVAPASGRGYRMLAPGAQETIAVPEQLRLLAFGNDGRFYLGDSGTGIVIFDPANKPSKTSRIADSVRAHNLVATSAGRLYVTETGDPSSSKVWLVQPSGEKILVDSGLNHPTGIAISPDGLWLAVVENKTHFGYSYAVQPDGTLKYKQRFYWLHVPDWADDSGAGPICFDRDGRLYIATRLGVQVLDRNGRTRAILPVFGQQVTGLCFGGEKFDTLYVAAGGKVYRRKLGVSGAPAFLPPAKLPAWGAG